MKVPVLGSLVLVAAVLPLPAQEGFRPMFNGKDLSGWVNVNCHPGTFFVKDGMIVTNGKPTGFLRTDKQYENFICEFDWLHVNKEAMGNSGFFAWADPIPAMGTGYTRGIEVQVLVNFDKDWATSHGDLFSIWGAKCIPDRPHPKGMERCLPSERLCKGGGEWNHYKIVANDGALKLHVNGKEVSGVFQSSPRKGYLALESEGAETWFKNLKIKELPSTKPKAEEIADLDLGHQSLFNGLDFAGWKWDEGHAGHWKAVDGIIAYDGKSDATEKHLWTSKDFGDFELVVDWRLNGPKVKKSLEGISPTGESLTTKVDVLDAGNSGILLRGSNKNQINIWCHPIGSGEIAGHRTDKQATPQVKAGATPKLKADNVPGSWNRFVITMKGDRATVKLNGKLVIENAELPGIAGRGPIGLQHHGDAVQFRNLFIRELK